MRMGTSLEDRPRYTPITTFETFPFPAGLTPRDTPSGPHAEAIVASAQDWAMAHIHGGDRGNQHTGAKVQDCTLATSKDRAATSGASERTQKMADKVAKADPELAKQVAHGSEQVRHAEIGYTRATRKAMNEKGHREGGLTL